MKKTILRSVISVILVCFHSEFYFTVLFRLTL